MKVLMKDNYDSFTYNLVQYTQELLGDKIDVRRNDKVSIPEMEKYDKIILSPGPGLPTDAGIIKEAIQFYASSKPILLSTSFNSDSSLESTTTPAPAWYCNLLL